MARATDADVRALVEMVASVSTTPFITTAEVMATTFLEGKGLSEELLTQIEIYLAAHFAVLAVERGGLIRDGMGESVSTYNATNNRIQGLSSTRFGQTAQLLDSTGSLKNTDPASLNALFTVVSGQNANPPS
jgi:hypothetical protein